jgi:hypothetical protein
VGFRATDGKVHTGMIVHENEGKRSSAMPEEAHWVDVDIVARVAARCPKTPRTDDAPDSTT